MEPIPTILLRDTPNYISNHELFRSVGFKSLILEDGAYHLIIHGAGHYVVIARHNADGWAIKRNPFIGDYWGELPRKFNARINIIKLTLDGDGIHYNEVDSF